MPLATLPVCESRGCFYIDVGRGAVDAGSTMCYLIFFIVFTMPLSRVAFFVFVIVRS
jgi:hypothetical protein